LKLIAKLKKLVWLWLKRTTLISRQSQSGYGVKKSSTYYSFMTAHLSELLKTLNQRRRNRVGRPGGSLTTHLFHKMPYCTIFAWAYPNISDQASLLWQSFRRPCKLGFAQQWKIRIYSHIWDGKNQTSTSDFQIVLQNNIQQGSKKTLEGLGDSILHQMSLISHTNFTSYAPLSISKLTLILSWRTRSTTRFMANFSLQFHPRIRHYHWQIKR